MITREQVADLQPGDVVDMVSTQYPDTIVRGTVRDSDGGVFRVGPLALGANDRRWNLTVVSRAPRPLYVNHPRTEPVPGDIVRDCDGDAWRHSVGRWFMAAGHSVGIPDISDCRPLTLLWDGATERVVPQ